MLKAKDFQVGDILVWKEIDGNYLVTEVVYAIQDDEQIIHTYNAKVPADISAYCVDEFCPENDIFFTLEYIRRDGKVVWSKGE
jgi:hypothetical protein